MVPPALRALEALGPALEAHLQLLLPALVRLICPGAGSAHGDCRIYCWVQWTSSRDEPCFMGCKQLSATVL